MRKLRRDLKRIFPNADITINSRNHYAIRLSNGATIIVAGTPSDWRYLRNAIAEARRQATRTPAKGE